MPRRLNRPVLRPSSLTGLLTGAIAMGFASAGCGDPEISREEVPKGVESAPDSGAPATGMTDESSEVTAAAVPTPAVGEQAPDQGEFPWTVPGGWDRIEGERPMRVATFTAPTPSGPVEVAVTRFPGEAGGLLANVNRWRGQMGLAAAAEADLAALVERFGQDEWSGYLLRVRGQTQHMLAAGVYERSQDRTWFIRATASPSEIDAIENDFGSFVRSLGPAEGR